MSYKSVRNKAKESVNKWSGSHEGGDGIEFESYDPTTSTVFVEVDTPLQQEVICDLEDHLRSHVEEDTVLGIVREI